jgi:Flp pilus assembly protein TadG
LPVSPASINAGNELRGTIMVGIRKPEAGQSTVEFALTTLIVMVILFGAMEFIVMIYTYNVLADAAKEGVRYAIVHGTGKGAANCSGPGGGGISCSDSTGANIQSVVSNFTRVSFHNSAAMVVTPSFPDSSSAAPSRVRVTISYVYQPFTNLGWPSMTVNAAAEGRIVF